VLDLGSGNNLVLAEGTAGFDYITGGPGSDTIVALQGNDTIDGTAGNADKLISRTSTNTVSGSSTSTIYGPATLGSDNAATYDPTGPGISCENWPRGRRRCDRGWLGECLS
jgi:Ca2+-binding RTX toxin-like protein